MTENVLIVIPARLGSSRFPGKPLAMIAGRTMLERVWRIACAVDADARVVISTDDESIKSHAEGFGAEVVLTSSACKTGTDRVAETARQIGGLYDIIFSFQGDAALMPPWVLKEVIAEMQADATIGLATPAVSLADEALARFVAEKRRGSTTGTSVVFNKSRDALYFSKGLIPFPRDGRVDGLPIFLHIGLYGYRRQTLERFTALEQSALEKIEQLEQLRALENGIPIRVVVVDTRGRSLHSVDSPEDVAAVEAIIAREGELLDDASGRPE